MDALPLVFLLLGIVLCLLAGALLLITWGRNWGATREECTLAMPGDDYFPSGTPIRVVMTRAASIAAPPATVWLWLAQLGRGAGFYSYDFLDNGRKTSARHLVNWIPSPRPGDASAIGYLRYLEVGKRIVWWAPGERFLGVTFHMCISLQVTPEGEGSRLVIRISADTAGRGARLARWVFLFIDSIMATRQVKGIRERAERHGSRREDPENPESGACDQYQFYEAFLAGGGIVGVPGRERAAHWRRVAIADEALVSLGDPCGDDAGPRGAA